ncbi:MAG: hypothetical protein AXA67_01415 [Methylothermaceae bacteria B42]|nr:MAG: hypothetical protein AXA67_01415 [Methylothermaceae bacteria B42]HHJ39063.1 hypothetical protein [Methylothermaceae bacterium]
MNRRIFLQFTAASSVTGLVLPNVAQAKPQLAGGLYYTREAPGRWKGKEGGHVPKIQISKDKGTVRVQVITAHEMNGCEHYIVKHIVLDGKYRFLDEHMFDPENDQEPVSLFSLGRYRGQIYVLSVCNKHDTWLNSTLV